MNKQARNDYKGVLIGVIVALLILFFGIPLTQIAKKPNPIFVASSSSEFCPSYLYFEYYNKEVSFEITYKNVGQGLGTFQNVISSEELLSKFDTKISEYDTYASKSWIVEGGQMIAYKYRLKINETSFPKKFTVITMLNCNYDTSLLKKLNCGSIKQCCTYNQTSQTSYELVGGNCNNN